MRRFPVCIWLLGLLPLCGQAAEAPVSSGARSAPARPAAASRGSEPDSRRFNKIEYVKLAEAATRLGLKVTKSERGRKVVLSGPNVGAEIEADTRDVTVNGVRVFLGDKTEEEGGELFVSRTDFERALTPLLRPGFGPGGTPVPASRVVVLDPGHGGKDHGTSRLEKVHALDVAARAKKILEAAGFKVVLTRTTDVYLTLAERPALAQANKADLFVSIHFNALPRDAKTSGMEIYTFPPVRQRGTNSWSPGERNNAEDEASPVNRHDYWSSALAHSIHRRFVTDLRTFDRGKKLMHLGVLRPLRCPGVLVECGFLTSEEEARKIATPAYRQQLAQAIAAGVRDYAAKLEAARRRS